MKILSYLIVLMLFFAGSSSCKKDTQTSVEELTAYSDEWTIQSMTGYSGDIDDLSNENAIFHYKKAGTLLFNADNSGIYTYLDKNYDFEWSHPGLALFLDITDQQNYASPFLYYYFAGQESTPYTSNESEHIYYYSVQKIDDNTFMLTHNPSNQINNQNFGGIEMILTKRKE